MSGKPLALPSPLIAPRSSGYRGIYCLLVCATLLDILTPELIAGTDKFLQA